MSNIINTYVIPIIRSDFIGRCLETLYEFTPPNFRVIVIDQTVDHEAQDKYEKYSHLWIRPYRNLGFAKGMNTGIVEANTEFITLCNDDLEFISKRWWDGIIETFGMDKKIIGVNPNSIKEGAWGYGYREDNKDTWVPPEAYAIDPLDPKSVVPKKENGQPFTFEDAKTESGYQWLLDHHPSWSPGTLCDAVAMWCTVFTKAGLREIGLLDEQFYPGGGEDYDMNCRAYSCGWPNRREVCDPSLHRRLVGTTKSWVWHWWGNSQKISAAHPDAKIFSSRERWNNNDEKWEGGFDVWGHKEVQGVRRPLNRSPIFIDEL